MKAARWLEPEESKDLVRECSFMAAIMLGAGAGQGEVRIKGKEWVVQRDECSEAAVLGVASFDWTLLVAELT